MLALENAGRCFGQDKADKILQLVYRHRPYLHRGVLGGQLVREPEGGESDVSFWCFSSVVIEAEAGEKSTMGHAGQAGKAGVFGGVERACQA